MGSGLNYSRNCMHLAAWKSDVESITLLLDAGRKYGLDLANVISTGHGNYGKTRTSHLLYFGLCAIPSILGYHYCFFFI